jgi:hypothetical protein
VRFAAPGSEGTTTCLAHEGLFTEAALDHRSPIPFLRHCGLGAFPSPAALTPSIERLARMDRLASERPPWGI